MQVNERPIVRYMKINAPQLLLSATSFIMTTLTISETIARDKKNQDRDIDAPHFG